MENVKIKQAQRRLKRITNKQKRFQEKRQYLRNKIESCKDNINRWDCPHCGHVFTKEESEKNIKNITKYTKQLEILEVWFDFNIPLKIRLAKPIQEVKERKQKEWDKKVQEYFKVNRNKLNKAIRELELPTIETDEEKKLWNDAILLQFDKRGEFENEEVIFDVEY